MSKLTFYETWRRAAEPVLPVLPALARKDLRMVVRASGIPRPQLLDIGGRNSPYTIGLDADVTVLDLPRDTDQQRDLYLGVSDDVLRSLQERRSNIVDVVIEDMTRCTRPDASFDIASAVEVLEHVPDDEAFLRQANRVLRPGGWLYLTTPNGDWCLNQGPHRNRDHIRHYRREQLEALIDRAGFVQRTVTYAAATGIHRVRGLKTIDLRHPLTVARTMAGNGLSHLESRRRCYQPSGTTNLVVVARKGPVPDLRAADREPEVIVLDEPVPRVPSTDPSTGTPDRRAAAR